MKDNKVVLSIILNPINFYPPTLNALVCLKRAGFHVISYSVDSEESMLQLNGLDINFKTVKRPVLFPSKVNGLLHLLLITCRVGFKILKEKPDFILMYDDTALIPVYFLKKLIPKYTKLWYHNHDILEDNMSNFSLITLAKKAQKSIFSNLDIFSIPSEERIPFFPMDKFSGKLIFLPNYPGKWLFNNFKTPRLESLNNIKLIYQGRLSEGHGLIELVRLLVNRKDIHLTYIGLGDQTYIEFIRREIERLNLTERVKILDPVSSYLQLPPITKECHIGIAINVPKSIHYETAGTASNKIYEYSGLGLPIIYYDHPQYVKYLDKYDWAFPTDITERSIELIIEEVKSNFNKFSDSAKRDFNNNLNFENQFEKVIQLLRDH